MFDRLVIYWQPGEEQQAWGSGQQSLAESSRELTEKEKNQKRKFDEVEVITGEENESNVLQVSQEDVGDADVCLETSVIFMSSIRFAFLLCST